MDYTTIVADLIGRKKEGDHWDFKALHHDNPVELVKDIICMANAQADSDRYIVFGVDNSYNVKGISGTPHRRTQSDIVTILRDSKFARDIYPDVYLEYISEMDVDLLIIKNRPEKPYFLSQGKVFADKALAAGVIYARTRDSNTPYRGTASYPQISQMWKEQFGLTDNPVAKMERLLESSRAWDANIGNREYAYNIDFPEVQSHLRKVRRDRRRHQLVLH